MSRRSGQKGSICKRGSWWVVRYYDDVPGQEHRPRRSEKVAPCEGPKKVGRLEAARLGAQLLEKLEVNDSERLEHVLSKNIRTFRDQVEWCRQNKRAWIEGRPGPVKTMESQLNKHILPFLGDLPLVEVDEKKVQEFIAHLRKTIFERRRPKGKNRQPEGDVVNSYKLSRKTILNIIGLVKKVVGRKVWINWELDLGRPERPKQRWFTERQMQDIVSLAIGQYKVLFTVLGATGIRIGEACALTDQDLDLENGVIFVSRSYSETASCMLPPKTENSVREIDIDECLIEILQAHLATRGPGLLLRAENGSPLRPGNVIKRVLNPILKQLGIPLGGKVNHAFRHGRVTVLRKNGCPGDLQKQWIGHSSLRTTDRYSHTDAELEYRKSYANRLGFKVVIQ